ncbi:hypothetical protein G6F50_017878 [Rhizopus delemar]|uniref:Uncharacterized protein n=1 Tax=Rhizopus delemar TaxID=936053 RepID=A0A9P6XNZ3_9FUNG|nr:hypothetical protein G6F50_017878 [Rhizopus delemar]
MAMERDVLVAAEHVTDRATHARETAGNGWRCVLHAGSADTGARKNTEVVDYRFHDGSASLAGICIPAAAICRSTVARAWRSATMDSEVSRWA